MPEDAARRRLPLPEVSVIRPLVAAVALALGVVLAPALHAQEPGKPARDSAFDRAGDRDSTEAAAPRKPTFEPDAEERITFDPSSPWRLSYFPYFTGASNEGPLLSFRVRYWQPADYDARQTYTAALTGDAGINAQGSRRGFVRFQAPLLWEGWRLNALVGAEREARLGYFGLGNDTDQNEDLVTDLTPYFYRVRRTRYVALGEVTRRLTGPLHAAALGSLKWAKFTDLPGPSVFRGDFGSELTESDVFGRVALIVDTRDNEYNTTRGLLLESGAGIGRSEGKDYTRLYGILRGYVPVREGTVVAARLAASGMGGSPPLDARFIVPGWERPVGVLGGDHSNRGLDEGRLVGEDVLFANVEIRHELLSFGDLGAVLVVPFLDAGRVFEDESFRLTTKDLKYGAGAGVGARILRSTVFLLNFAGGSEGFKFSLSGGWMF